MKKLFLVLCVVFMNVIILKAEGDNLYILDPRTNAYYPGMTAEMQEEKKDLDAYYSELKLGSFVENGKTIFRLFAPNPVKVVLEIYKNPGEKSCGEYEMVPNSDAVWETVVNDDLTGIYYGYRVTHKDSEPVLCLDPYAKAVASYNTYMGKRLAIVHDDKYDWEGDEWIRRDWRDAVIYEAHVRDLTAHKSSGVKQAGQYLGLTEKGTRGGLDYIKNLGVNTVELLPAMEFANIEIPYNKPHMGKKNTWNPYERNHWGYMTAAFFAPAAYYSEDWQEIKFDTWMGTTGKQVTHFKDMVKTFHKEGIAVVMDVVYNHLSEYEFGNLKEIDRDYYFRLDSAGNLANQSGCANDIKTERPMMRRLIVESILFWMKEYHIDGFRFDLGKLLDWETIETIIREARKINPDVIFVCEPWGGGYDPAGFSLREWGSWNDQIRNGIKGENPNNGHGWIFGKWYGNNNISRIKSYVHGTLVRDSLGLFQRKEHSVNYLEAHDGYTMSDFIRIGLGDAKSDQKIADLDKHYKLTAKQMKMNKLAASFLLTSQGMVMIHAGQEYARSKVIPHLEGIQDPHAGQIDHNSYEKDNETNYMNYEHYDLNKELADYYKGLIELREKNEAFRRAEYEDISFVEDHENQFALGYKLKYKDDEFFVVFNANHDLTAKFNLPEGDWDVLVNAEKAGVAALNAVSGKIELTPISSFILKKR